MEEFESRTNDKTITRMLQHLGLALINQTPTPTLKGRIFDFSEVLCQLDKLDKIMISMERLSKETSHFQKNKQPSKSVHMLLSDEANKLKNLSTKQLNGCAARKIAFINMIFTLLGQIDSDPTLLIAKKNALSLGVIACYLGNYSIYVK